MSNLKSLTTSLVVSLLAVACKEVVNKKAETTTFSPKDNGSQNETSQQPMRDLNGEGPSENFEGLSLTDLTVAEKFEFKNDFTSLKNKYYSIGDFRGAKGWNAEWYKNLSDGHIVYTAKCNSITKAFYWKNQTRRCDPAHAHATFSEAGGSLDAPVHTESLFEVAKTLNKFFEYNISANPNYDLINTTNHFLKSNPDFSKKIKVRKRRRT